MKLGEIADRVGCALEGDPSIEITRLAPIETAGPGELTFVANRRYVSRLATTRASAVILAPDVPATGRAVLRATDPYLAFVDALELFHRPVEMEPGIHPTAIIDASARLGEGAAVGPYAVVGRDVTIGARARLDAHVVIYPGAKIGDRFVAHAGAVVHGGVEIGNDVRLQAGAVVGSDGFGYVPDPERGVRPIPQAGTVVLEDGVEIGVHSVVDRATIGVTRVRRNAKIDNLVQIAHGCDVGELTFLAAQVGLAGSVRVGTGVQAGGQAGVAGHLSVGDGARLAAKAGVSNDVPAGATMGGYPAEEIHAWRRMVAASRMLPDFLRRLRRLERTVSGPGNTDDA